jgi:hypothetical protein
VLRHVRCLIQFTQEAIMLSTLITKRSVLTIPFIAAMLSIPVVHAADLSARGDAANAASGTSSGKVVSGGVGIGARDSLQQRAEDYGLKLVFAQTPSGDYLAAVPVTISDRRGNTAVDTVSDGPWMYVDLPNGTYSVKAKFNGRTETRQVSVTSGSQRTLYLRFPDGSDRGEAMNATAAR